MDAGGSMHPYVQMCSQLFTAVNRASHFKDLRYYYFHNCVYDHLYLDPSCNTRNSVLTARTLKELPRDYKLIIVGDAPWRRRNCSSKTASSGGALRTRNRGSSGCAASTAISAQRLAQPDPPRALGEHLRSGDHTLGALGLPHVRAHRGRPHAGGTLALGPPLIWGGSADPRSDGRSRSRGRSSIRRPMKAVGAPSRVR